MSHSDEFPSIHENNPNNPTKVKLNLHETDLCIMDGILDVFE